MAAPVYGTDLIDISTAENATNFAGIGGGGTVAAETDFYIQGSACVSKATAATWRGNSNARGGVLYNVGSSITVPASGAVLVWMYWWGPGVLYPENTPGSGGAGIVIGSSSLAYRNWAVLGSDSWQFGGWKCMAVDPNSGITPTFTLGSPNTGTNQYIGWEAVVSATTAIGKGAPYGIDVMRYGRCTLSCTAGDAGNGYATFISASDYDNNSTRRWGLLTPQNGAYYQQGRLLFGSGTTAVDFRDANRAIFINDTKKVVSAFNTFEVQSTASRVDLNAITITALGTNSRGRWLTTDNADVNIDNCSFTDMGTFQFQSSGTINTTTFRRCGQVDQSGAVFDKCTFDSCRDPVTLVANAPNSITNCTFISDGDNHAIQITTSGSCTFVGHKFTGYVAGTGSSTSSNAVVYNTSGGSVTISVTSGDAPSIRNSGSSTTTVITGQKTLTLTGLKAGSEVRIYQSGTTTELAGVESSTTSFAYTYTYVSDLAVNIAIIALGYISIWQAYTLTNTDASVPIQQQIDRQYYNPT